MTIDEAGLLVRALDATADRYRRAARAAEGRTIVEQDGLLLVAAPDIPWITGAHLMRPPRDPGATLAHARSFFEARGLAWHIVAAGAAAEAIAPAARAANLQPGEQMPGMLLFPLRGETPAVPGFVVREVRDPRDLTIFNTISAEGFGGGANIFERLYTPASLAEPDVTLYLGYLDGEPVATAVRGTSRRIAGIGGVSTVPAARRRGIGAAITLRAALDGIAEGCVASFLQATEMGYTVYERMGYRTVIDFETWDATP